MHTLPQDLQSAVRTLKRSRGFCAAVIGTLALAIGANTAIFSVVNAVVLRPLPYRDAGQLVLVWATNARTAESPVSYADFPEIAERTPGLERAALLQLVQRNLTGEGEPESIATARVSAGLFQVLEVNPMLGRAFLREDEKAGGEGSLLLSYSLWRRRFGGDPAVVGRVVDLNGERVAVVGVMPPGFDFPHRCEAWVPLVPEANERVSRLARTFQLIARLRHGTTPRQAQVQLTAVAAGLAEQFPTSDWGWSLRLAPLQDVLVGAARLPLLMLLVAISFVLLIASANVANLSLARLAVRRREFAVRIALGATRWCIMRQLLLENLTLAAVSGALGLSLAFWGVRFLGALGSAATFRPEAVDVDVRVLGFTLLASLTSGLIFGLAPAIDSSRRDPSAALAMGSLGRGGRFQTTDHRVTHGTFVASELALSFILLVGAGLALKSLWRLTSADLGFRAEGVLTLQIVRPTSGHGGVDSARAFFRALVERVRALPGIEGAAVASGSILRGRWMNVVFDLPGQPKPPCATECTAQFQAVSPDFFRVLGIRLLKGRFFNDSDARSAPGVIIVNEAFTRLFFAGGNPIGKPIAVPRLEGAAHVVGVVANTRDVGLGVEPQPKLYACYLQAPSPSMTLVVRSATAPSTRGREVRNQVWAVDGTQPVVSPTTLEQEIADASAEPRYRAVLLGTFAGLAVTLSLIGLYSVASYSVTTRTREIAVRIALGASRTDILRLVARRGFLLTLVGMVFGWSGALALTRFLGGVLYGVSPSDPLTFLFASLLLAATSTAATWIPASRATKVDPAQALRHE